MFNVLDTAVTFNPIQDGPYGAAHIWGAKRVLLPKICQIYPTMTKLGTVVFNL